MRFYGYRFYAPDIGRWPNRDPIGERGGINLILMIENNIVNGIDYLGLDVHKVKNGEFEVDVKPQTARPPLFGVIAKITFTPKNCKPCKSIRLVQAVQVYRNKKDDIWYGSESNREKIKTKLDREKGVDNGWFIDHKAGQCLEGDGSCSPYYNTYASMDGISTDGSDSSPTTLIDLPSAGNNAYFSFETCARCVDTGDFIGCVSWGWNSDNNGVITIRPSSAVDAPTPNFLSSLDMFYQFYKIKKTTP